MKLYEMVRRLRAKAREDCPPKFPHERMHDWIAADALEAQAREIERLREALEEIARLGCEDWPGGHVLTCSCNSCIARRALVSERDPVSRTPIADALHEAYEAGVKDACAGREALDADAFTETGVALSRMYVCTGNRVSEPPATSDAGEWMAWIADQSAGGYVDLHVPATVVSSLSRALEPARKATALRDALQEIAESHDAGRHDGRPEPCPAHDAETMWAIATRVLASDEPGKGEGVP